MKTFRTNPKYRTTQTFRDQIDVFSRQTFILFVFCAGLAFGGCQSKPQVAGSPQTVPARQVEREFLKKRGTGKHGNVSGIIELFNQARTVRELNHWSSVALAALHGRSDPEAQKLRDLVYRTYNQVAPGVNPTYTTGFEGAGLCDVDFDSPEVLDMFIDDAQAMFSTPPHWVQACGTGEIKVEPTVYSHYHLSYEDPTIDCLDENGMYGRGEPGNCDALDDPTLEPRFLGSHQGNEIIRIRLMGDDGPLPFRMDSFNNVGDEAVRFSYKNGAGQWFQWPSLAGNQSWYVGDYVINVLEVQIINAGNSPNCGIEGWEAAFPGGCSTNYLPFYLDDFDITPLFQ